MSTAVGKSTDSRAPADAVARAFVMSTERTPFIDSDVELLRRHYAVDCHIGGGIGSITSIVRGSLKSDIAISWFASVYSFFMVAAARARRRPAIIILGGVDTARDERIGYGIWLSRWRRPLLRWTLANASRIIAVDAALVRSLAASSGMNDLPVDVIPTGYDPAFWTPDGERDGYVLAVAGCATLERALVKGVDLFVEAARRLPEARFVLVGAAESIVARFSPPENLTLIPQLDPIGLRSHYRRASVFALPSRHEGLPNALCEAMLCGCIPVGSRVGGVDDAIGDCGFVVEKEDSSALVAAIASALVAPQSQRQCARERITELFPMRRRESRLVGVIEELLHA